LVGNLFKITKNVIFIPLQVKHNSIGLGQIIPWSNPGQPLIFSRSEGHGPALEYKLKDLIKAFFIEGYSFC